MMNGRTAALAAGVACLCGPVGCGVPVSGSSATSLPESTAGKLSSSAASSTSSSSSSSEPPTAENNFAYCPAPPAATPGVTLEPLYIAWRQLAEDPEIVRDEITWLDSGPGGGADGKKIPVRAVDLTGSEGERELTGRFDEVSISAIRWALAQKAKVVVGTPAHVRDDGYLTGTFIVVFPGGADPFFVGACAQRDWEENLRALLGSDYAQQVAALAAGPIRLPDDPKPQSPFLLPGEASPAVLSALNHITFEFDLPDQWAGARLDDSYALVTRVGAGWNEGLPLTWDKRDVHSTRIGAYLPESGPVELWVLGNDGDITSPVGRLATLDARELLRLSEAGTRDNAGVVRVSITTTLSAAEVAGGNMDAEVTLSALD